MITQKTITEESEKIILPDIHCNNNKTKISAFAATLLVNKTAILGNEGSFHELAADKYFGKNSGKIFCHSFEKLIETVSSGEAVSGLMAIENSVAGSLISNYPLLKNSSLCISGEIIIHVQQNLMALPGQNLSNIKKICSHYMAIEQCRGFLDKLNGIEIIPGGDTATNAIKISREKLLGVATIAGKNASEKYGLPIIKAGIETNKNNYTRFLVLKKNDNSSNENANKASLTFCLRHEKGSLAAVLSVLSFYGVNLSKIQSVPIPGKEWKYDFYTDLLFDDYKTYRSAISAIKPLTGNLKILGEYSEK
ncbi:MAG: hypothetical protein A2W91_06890 [Bacteroidetes bacterium GWF2_38_335]|nr:MAG: hypothetical protein A2W91_06890 [Bacteroidetes bacterium GWF2_38_335]OFY80920.1 MAG: hypothetical protein A2281_04815 [Bacteroidetes bacterium RIFOXYA12_FULL_38_20]